VDWIAALGMQASLRALFETNRAIAETDLRPEVARIKLPTLIIHGERDKSAPIDLTARRTAALIAGSELNVYEGAPHGLVITHQDRLTHDLADWIR
jgi:non-heme chloroperoxidase